jgi:glyoxylase-like metal-dependent hydrolase (beta-lactamase superfamily II)
MKRGTLLRSRSFGTALFSAVLLLGFLAAAWAEAPMVKTQVPGYYRLMVGQFEVTALYDGSVELDAKLMKNATEQEINVLLAQMFIAGPKMQTAVNAYLINTGSKLVLVDAGAAKVFGPTLGSVMQNLRAAGYDPAQIDAVMISHMHGDHVGGLLNGEGKPAFPNAVVYLSKGESDFWLSADVAERAPAEYKKYFKMARDLAQPYLALGKWKTFGDGEMPVPGVKAILIPGHTPGHCAYEITDGKESLLITGDMVHSLAIQLPRPDVVVDFDVNKVQAASVRLALFESAAKRKVLVAGMHLPFPGIGRLRAEGGNAYAWVPVEFVPVRGSGGGATY